MSKINAVRLINLNYNNNSIRISDDIFHFNGKSTLMSLQNGGGKSVLVQMISAPFVHKRYRDAKDRPFEGYFTTNKPTFIMVEWALDKGAGYCLTGMMVRKSQITETDNDDRLEMYNFICEYNSSCSCDIINFPVVEKNNKEVVLKSFRECRQIFEEYKRDNSVKFNYYDMNNSAQSKQYFDKLAQYQIYYKEWENIIKKVNLKESGLSELFADCKDEKGLVEKWFIDAVENKLNKDKDRMKEFRNIIEKYVISYKSNQSKIERRNTINNFKEDAKDIEETANDYKITSDSVTGQENLIAGFRILLEELEQEKNTEKNSLEDSKNECIRELEQIEYEKISFEIAQLLDKQLFHISNRDMIEMERDAIEAEIQAIEDTLHKLEYAKQKEQVGDLKQDEMLIKERLEVLRDDGSRLEPERKALGKSLFEHYNNSLNVINDDVKDNKQNLKAESDKMSVYEEKLKQLTDAIFEHIAQISKYKERLNAYNVIEDSFNLEYKEKFARNIVGEYEPGFLNIKKEQYQKEFEECSRSCVSHRKELETANEEARNIQRQIEDAQIAKNDIAHEIAGLKSEKALFDEENAQRQIIMRYLEIDEAEQWNMDKILLTANRKLAETEELRRMLEKEEDILQKEYVQLTQGKILELPNEVIELFEELNIHIVYGMDWLNRNGYDVAQNEKLVRKQPFLPYSIILSAQDIKRLSDHDKDIYTSFPIPIIARENLEKAFSIQDAGLFEIEGVNFFVWFNEKLLDEEQLQVLVAEKEKQIQDKKELIANRKNEYEEEFERREKLRNQKVNKELFEQNLSMISEKENTLAECENNVIELKNAINVNQEHINELTLIINNEQRSIETMQKRENAFERLSREYDIHLENKHSAARYEKEKQRAEDSKKLNEEALVKCKERIKTLETKLLELDTKHRFYDDKISKFAEYADIIIDTDLELVSSYDEQEVRFEAITSSMSMQVQDLEKQLQKANANYSKALQMLERIRNKYELSENLCEGIVYNEKEETHQEIMLEDRHKKYKIKDRQWNDEDKEIAVCSSHAEIKKKEMLDRFGHEQPLDKEMIRTADFDAAINQIKYRLELLEKDIIKADRRLRGISESLNTLEEYKNLICIREIEWDIDFRQLDNKGLREYQGKMLRDYRHLKEARDNKKNRITDVINKIIRKEMYFDDYYKKPLEAMLSLTDNADMLLSQLDTTLQSYNSQMEKLAVDISLIEKEKERIVELLGDYCYDVHKNLGQIDSNSTISIREKNVKMLKLQLPEWSEQEGIYQLKINNFVDELTIKGVEILDKNENPQEYFGTRVTTKYLYDSVVGIANVQMKLYKIEAQREYPISWAQAAKNSGGEGFLTAFVILSSLLYYMRRDETDIFADRNEGKVLVMDNPFAQTNAAHLLKPLMEMADKMNTQLICFSGLGGDSIYSRFNNIYILNLVASSLRGGMQYLRGEHLRGEEMLRNAGETLVSSQVEVVEQQTLFEIL